MTDLSHADVVDCRIAAEAGSMVFARFTFNLQPCLKFFKSLDQALEHPRKFERYYELKIEDGIMVIPSLNDFLTGQLEMEIAV